MRTSLRKVSGAAILCAATILLLFVATATAHRAGRASPAPTKSKDSHPSQTARKMGHPASQEARIARIENGLLPPVALKGEPLHTKTMAEEMARLKVPGVSVAFYDHGKIVWTRG